MQQFNNLIEFRQTVYHRALTRSRDAQFELVDALLLSAPIHSFPELSPSFGASGTVPIRPLKMAVRTARGWNAISLNFCPWMASWCFR